MTRDRTETLEQIGVNATPRLKVLHVAESFAGGVLAAIRDYVKTTPDIAHHLIYSPREDAPLGKDDLSGFASASAMPVGHRARVRFLRVAVSRLSPDAVHAHSSFAGVYARLALSTRRIRIIYTPHCYAFERKDISLISRAFFAAVEQVLAWNTSAFAACSPREVALSKWLGSRAAIEFVPNVPPGGWLPSPSAVTTQRSTSPLRVAAAGRASKQKDPGYFLACVGAARDAGMDVDAVWVGGDPGFGDEGDDLGIRVTGWLSRDAAAAELGRADVYIHTARWEGFPLAILEVLALGVPVVARDIPAFAELDLPIIRDPRESPAWLRDLAEPESRKAVWERAASALSSFNSQRQREGLQKVYAGAY